MPKLSPDKTEKQNRVFQSIVEGNKKLYNISDSYLATRLGVGLRTFRKRLDDPELFSNGDNRILIEVLHITKDQWSRIGGFEK